MIIMNELRIYTHKSLTVHPANFAAAVLAGDQFPDLNIRVIRNNIFVCPLYIKAPEEPNADFLLIYEEE